MEKALRDLNWTACYDNAGPANDGSAAFFHLKKQMTHLVYNAPTTGHIMTLETWDMISYHINCGCEK